LTYLSRNTLLGFFALLFAGPAWDSPSSEKKLKKIITQAHVKVGELRREEKGRRRERRTNLRR
jgi:hypothetical protein